LRLQLRQLPPHGMHCDAICQFIECRQKTDDFDFSSLPQNMQTPGRVFATTPRKQNALLVVTHGAW
jgi:hypothetical protein